MAMPTELTYEAGSYRDRDGRVFYGQHREVYRALSRRALAEWQVLRAARFFQKALDDGKIVRTEEVDAVAGATGLAALGSDGAPWAGFLRHDRIPFVSYPYEWTFGMLRDAALLQLELLAAALEEDMTLKDGTAYNVQFVGERPVFIDVASFERHSPGQPWAGYRQFCRTFLYPLFLQAYKSVAFHPFLRGCLDGITPGDCSRLMSLRDLVRPGVLTHVALHARFEANGKIRESDPQKSLSRAGFHKSMIRNNVENLSRIIRRLKWDPPDSKWSEYAECNNYTESDRRRKAAFVGEAVATKSCELVWDLGCNTGDYSRIAAENSRCVVAMDADHLAVERLYQSLKREPGRAGGGSILPLVSNVADPSPNLGWRGLERKSTVERGRPQLTLCLALIHHLVIDAGIPLRELLAWLAGLGSSLVIEFVDKADPMVQRLLRNRRDDCPDYERSHFESCLNELFDVSRTAPLESGTRTLYFAQARAR